LKVISKTLPLNIYKRGYAVRVNPNEYFDSDGNRRQDFPKSLELGENSFLYFKDIKDWKSYGNTIIDNRMFSSTSFLYEEYFKL